MEFKVSSALKDIVGKDLITDDNIAIFELVKNSYDAHAKNVIITFDDDKITIADNGKGMTFSDIENKWLFLGYSGKRDNSEDADLTKNPSYRDKIQERKHFAGSKGIGRVSSDRLGKKVILNTSVETSTKVEKLTVDWTKFEVDQKKEFGTISIPHTSFTKNKNLFPKNHNSGTIFEIEDLNTKWTREKILNLKHSLEKLINPFNESNDFEIEIICEKQKQNDLQDKKGGKLPERQKVNGLVKNAILDILNLKTTHLSLKITNNKVVTIIKDRGELVYHTEETKMFSYLDNLQTDLYYLNRKAKHNFTLKMGIPVIQFGSIFLFKNGFRVQPYGSESDDSWNIDFRKQQGHNRYLGTRDLFGRVEIVTNNTKQFKEVSSRDGGLVKTEGYKEIMEIFELAHRRLERYVVGVLWGEAFKRKNYFGDGEEGNEKANAAREDLKSDQDSEKFDVANVNLGSKIDFIQLIKSLTSQKDIKIVEYNKSLVDLFNEKLEDSQSRFIADLNLIADKMSDKNLAKSVKNLEARFLEAQAKREAAEKREAEEKEKREAAEKREAEEKEKREAAEQREKEERKKKEAAELEALREEKRRREAEEAKRKAEELERKAKEKAEQERAQKELAEAKAAEEKAQKELAEAKAAEEKAQKELALEREKKEQLEKEKLKEYSYFQEAEIDKLNNITQKDVTVLVSYLHHIGIYSGAIDTGLDYLNTILPDDDEIKEVMSDIVLSTKKISVLSRMGQKTKVELDDDHNFDVVSYVDQYVNKVLNGVISEPQDISIINSCKKPFELRGNPTDLSIIIDNLLNNSSKFGARKVTIELKNIDDNKINMIYTDDGSGLHDSILDKKKILGLGFSTSAGSGIGLYHIQEIVNEYGGEVVIPDCDTGFRIEFIFKGVK